MYGWSLTDKLLSVYCRCLAFSKDVVERFALKACHHFVSKLSIPLKTRERTSTFRLLESMQRQRLCWWRKRRKRFFFFLNKKTTTKEQKKRWKKTLDYCNFFFFFFSAAPSVQLLCVPAHYHSTRGTSWRRHVNTVCLQITLAFAFDRSPGEISRHLWPCRLW